MAVRFTSRIKEWTRETENKLDIAVLDIVTDIQRVSSILAPRDTGALANSGRISREAPAHYKVIFGGRSVPYARRRHFENKKNPGTLRYLQRGGDQIGRNIRRYLGNI